MEKLKKYYYAADISTSCCGFSLFNENGKLMELKHIKLDIDRDIAIELRYLVKAEMFKNYIKDYKQYVLEKYNACISEVFVEEPLMSSNNIFTVGTLLRFNGICCYLFNEIFGNPPKLITIHEVRKVFCPEFVKVKHVKGERKETLSFPKNLGAKKFDKKEYIWQKVSEKEKSVEWLFNSKGNLMKENFDMSDAYAVGYSSLKLKGIIK